MRDCCAGILQDSCTQVKYYSGKQLLAASANRMLCLPFEKVVAYDLHENSGYNMPIIHADYQIGESPFRFYYRDMESETIIDNGVIAEVGACSLTTRTD